MGAVALFSDEILAKAKAVVTAAEAAGLTIGTAESCTGGLIAAALTEVPGASRVVEGAIVAYANRVKADQLRVPVGGIAEVGAVSEETALAMAEGALASLAVDVAIAVTGIAGPGGGSAEKPVGLVHMAILDQGNFATEARRVFPGDRTAIRLATVDTALDLLADHIAKRSHATLEVDQRWAPAITAIDRHMQRAHLDIPDEVIEIVIDLMGGVEMVSPDNMALVVDAGLFLPPGDDEGTRAIDDYIAQATQADLFAGPITPANLEAAWFAVLRIDRVDPDQPISVREVLSGDRPLQLIDRDLREQLDPGSTVALRVVQVGDVCLPAGPPIILEPGAAARLRKEFPKPPTQAERAGLAILVYATEILGISIPDALDQRAEAAERERKAAKPAPRRR